MGQTSRFQGGLTRSCQQPTHHLYDRLAAAANIKLFGIGEAPGLLLGLVANTVLKHHLPHHEPAPGGGINPASGPATSKGGPTDANDI
ncbi:hypothetical protein D3C85_1326750 [compost metagenome]